jgi:hypothetical protein
MTVVVTAEVVTAAVTGAAAAAAAEAAVGENTVGATTATAARVVVDALGAARGRGHARGRGRGRGRGDRQGGVMQRVADGHHRRRRHHHHHRPTHWRETNSSKWACCTAAGFAASRRSAASCPCRGTGRTGWFTFHRLRIARSVVTVAGRGGGLHRQRSRQRQCWGGGSGGDGGWWLAGRRCQRSPGCRSGRRRHRRRHGRHALTPCTLLAAAHAAQVERVEDVYKEGDEVWVKVMQVRLLVVSQHPTTLV